MDNLEYSKKLKKKDNERKDVLKLFPNQISEWEIEYRRTKATEIIAETLIDLIVPLENIETILNRR